MCIRLVIRMNNVLTNDPCAICGARTDPTGVDLMLADRPALVCHKCGLTHAPALTRLLDLAEMAHNFVQANNEAFGIVGSEVI